MIPLTASTRIRLALAPIDFRRGIDSLVALCQEHLHQQPRSGTVYVFISTPGIRGE